MNDTRKHVVIVGGGFAGRDGGTAEAFSAVLKALHPVVEPLVTPPFGRPAPGTTIPTTTPASGTPWQGL